MAGNTRGKMKEELEGCHRNYDWVLAHCEKMLVLIGDKNPKVKAGVEAIVEGTQILDEACMKIYATI